MEKTREKIIFLFLGALTSTIFCLNYYQDLVIRPKAMARTPAAVTPQKEPKPTVGFIHHP